MQTSIFLAKLLGPVILTLGVALALNKDRFLKLAQDFMESDALMLINGLLTLVAGLAVVLTHNVWTWNWPVIITIFGWAMVFAGIARTLLLARLRSYGEKLVGMFQKPWLVALVTAIYVGLGAILTYHGYLA